MIRVSLSRDCAAGQEHVDKTQVRGMTHRDTDDMVRCAAMLWRGSSFDSNGESEKEPPKKTKTVYSRMQAIAHLSCSVRGLSEVGIPIVGRKCQVLLGLLAGNLVYC